MINRKRIKFIITLDEAYEKWRKYMDYISVRLSINSEERCPFGGFVQALRKRGYSVI